MLSVEKLVAVIRAERSVGMGEEAKEKESRYAEEKDFFYRLSSSNLGGQSPGLDHRDPWLRLAVIFVPR